MHGAVGGPGAVVPLFTVLESVVWGRRNCQWGYVVSIPMDTVALLAETFAGRVYSPADRAFVRVAFVR